MQPSERVSTRKLQLPDGEAIRTFVSQNGIYFVLVLLIFAIALRDVNFLSPNNFRNILVNISTRVIMALGAGAILITGGVDLSSGRIVGLAAVLSASMLQTAEYSRR